MYWGRPLSRVLVVPGLVFAHWRLCGSIQPLECVMRNLLSLQATDVAEIREILGTARAFKEILGRPVKKVPTLRGKSVITLFYESSTRTRTSFELAAKYM